MCLKAIILLGHCSYCALAIENPYFRRTSDKIETLVRPAAARYQVSHSFASTVTLNPKFLFFRLLISPENFLSYEKAI